MSKSIDADVPEVIEGANLSWAWADAIRKIQGKRGHTLSPLLISIHGFDAAGYPVEDPAMRQDLDALLAAQKEWDIETVAFTIFPERLYQIAGGDRAKLFDIYRRTFPKYQAMNRQLNGKGLYFERLTMFGRGPSNGNQLEFIIDQFSGRKGVRDSMLQASIFDPERDHSSSAQLGFPCLQHVSFVPTNDGMVTNAFYATQQLFNKAYGNYLGLAQLGRFVAKECGMKPARLNVYVGVAKLEGIAKSDPRLVALVDAAGTRMQAAA
ncbi:thymidylate synthase [Hyphomicrobium sp.]|uniref:thymidylate synthase n=1 Tax=Hyphomicrobium sp. TaxID=82 RepID=UPI001DAD9366|nr:thymidylate synthase [Hyphomicrobium sp.]MBY0561003.1 thymidylate synthase [Hyphomicrobium sp.]